MHFPVYVVLPLSVGAIPSGKSVRRHVESVLLPHQYVARDLPGSEQPRIEQRGWWDWYVIGGHYAKTGSDEPTSSIWDRLLGRPRADVHRVSHLLETWSRDVAPVRVVTPDGVAHGGHAWSDEDVAEWLAKGKELLTQYRDNLYVVVDCHK